MLTGCPAGSKILAQSQKDTYRNPGKTAAARRSEQPQGVFRRMCSPSIRHTRYAHAPSCVLPPSGGYNGPSLCGGTRLAAVPPYARCSPAGRKNSLTAIAATSSPACATPSASPASPSARDIIRTQSSGGPGRFRPGTKLGTLGLVCPRPSAADEEDSRRKDGPFRSGAGAHDLLIARECGGRADDGAAVDRQRPAEESSFTLVLCRVGWRWRRLAGTTPCRGSRCSLRKRHGSR